MLHQSMSAPRACQRRWPQSVMVYGVVAVADGGGVAKAEVRAAARGKGMLIDELSVEGGRYLMPTIQLDIGIAVVKEKVAQEFRVLLGAEPLALCYKEVGPVVGSLLISVVEVGEEVLDWPDGEEVVDEEGDKLIGDHARKEGISLQQCIWLAV